MNKQLTAAGFNVISTWIQKENGINTPVASAADAVRDTDEVSAADVVLCIMMDDKYAYRGTWFECSYGLALGKRVIIVCPGLGFEKRISDTRYEYPYQCMTNVFFWHPEIERVKTLDEAIELLRK
jgi:nucleoside 2-deoxyribosyltransferase